MDSIARDFTYNSETGELFRGNRKVGTKSYHGYLKLNYKNKIYLAHRLCWFLHYGEWPNVIDHINHDKTDNRICNLRNVDHLENNKNQKLRKSNKLGFSGIYWDGKRGKWRTQIRIQGKKTNLGGYDDLFDAVSVVMKARKENGYHANHGS